MKEIEVKILEIDRKEIETKILDLGAKKVFDGVVETILFDFPDKRLTKNNSILRLRKMGDKAFITTKSFISNKDAKICEENETFVSDFEDTRKLFKGIGLEEIDYFKKNRTSYKLDKTSFEIESLTGEYNYIPEFLEIESSDIKTIYKYVELLGFSKEDCKSWGGAAFVNYYKERILVGKVVEGSGYGQKYVSIYNNKFKEILGFEAFPGTLNLKVDVERKDNLLSKTKKLTIEEFKIGDKTYGAVHCYKVTINKNIKGAILVPVKTKHNSDTIEIIAPINLRKVFNLVNDSTISLV